jgi:hypothetical protein
MLPKTPVQLLRQPRPTSCFNESAYLTIIVLVLIMAFLCSVFSLSTVLRRYITLTLNCKSNLVCYLTYFKILKLSLGQGYPEGRLPGIGGQYATASSALWARILSEASQRPNGGHFISNPLE